MFDRKQKRKKEKKKIKQEKKKRKVWLYKFGERLPDSTQTKVECQCHIVVTQ